MLMEPMLVTQETDRGFQVLEPALAVSLQFEQL